MCLAIPVQITEILDGDRALASVGGVVREIGTSLVDELEVGDYVILHVGYALSRLRSTAPVARFACCPPGAWTWPCAWCWITRK